MTGTGLPAFAKAIDTVTIRKRRNQGNTDSRQRVFDFNTRNRSLREPFVGETHAKHALRVLSDFAGDACDCWPSYGLIARCMETSERTAKRAIAYLLLQKLIIVYPPQKRRRSNTYRLRWAEITDRAAAAKEQRQGCQRVTPGVTHSHLCSDSLSPEAYKEASTPLPPKSRKRRAAVRAASRLPDDWQEVVVEIIEYGVLDPEPAAVKARQRQCTPDFVREVIQYARSKVTSDGTQAWGGGALRQRIMNLVPSQSVDDETLWIPPSDEFRAARRREAEHRKDIGKAKQQAETRAKHEKGNQELQELESAFGTQLDSITEAECDELAEQASGGRNNF